MTELLGLLVPGCAAGPSLNKKAIQVLAPTGKLRVGLYAGGPTNIILGTTLAESKGVGFDLGKELALRMGVTFEPLVYPNSGGVISGLKSGEWDIAFLALSPDREDVISFSAPFLFIEHGYLVPEGSPISTHEAADQTGIRIGAPQGGSVIAVLNRIIRNASVVPVPGFSAAAEMLEHDAIR